MAMRQFRRLSLRTILLLAATVTATGAGAADVPVDVALVMAGDVSGSMTSGELATQREGFAAAFHDPELVSAIHSGAIGRIAVTYVEWAGSGEQWVVVPWTVVADQQSSDAFGDRLVTAPAVRGSQTSLSNGLLFAARQFETSGVVADRETIDVSGDGPNNAGPPIGRVRDFVVGKGITVNGLPLSPAADEKGPFAYLYDQPGIDLDSYYRDCVIGGPGAFTMPVSSPAEVFDAIRRKLVLEIAALPARVIRADYIVPATPRVECVKSDRSASP